MSGEEASLRWTLRASALRPRPTRVVLYDVRHTGDCFFYVRALRVVHVMVHVRITSRITSDACRFSISRSYYTVHVLFRRVPGAPALSREGHPSVSRSFGSRGVTLQLVVSRCSVYSGGNTQLWSMVGSR